MAKEVKEPTEVQEEVKKVEAKYKFIKQFKTDKITYNVGDDCKETNKDVLAYLLTNKYIK